MTRFISIISLGSGTGKTTIALNLGLALHQLNQKVLVFDADFSKPNMLTHLDIGYLPVTLDEVFSADRHVFDAIYRHPSGLKIIPSLSLHDYAKVYDHLQDLLVDYDYVIIDTPREEGPLREVLKGANEAIIVHTPAYSSKIISDAKNLLKELKILNLGIILNKSQEDSVNSMYELPVIAKFPEHRHVTQSFRMKHPVLHTHPRGPPARQFMNLGRKLVV